MKTKICKECKNKFIPNQNASEYCSDICHELWHKRYEKKYKKLHRENHKLYMKKYFRINKDYLKNWREKNKDKIKKQVKEYRLNHIIRFKKLESIKYKTDVNFRITECCRSRLYLALKGFLKVSTTFQLIGCSTGKLKQHLESKFQTGMSWKNYGKKGWVIDHIVPCASFDFSKPSQQRKCFHYTNLQPLWLKDNLRKGKK
jgi:hypothetical protein